VSQTSIPPGLAKAVSLGNRRASIRYRCAPATIGKVISSDDQEFQLACIVDLSLRGIGMQLARAIEPGRLVIVAIRTNDGLKTIDLSGRVTHCIVTPHDDWQVGCELTTPLTPDELEQLL